MTALLSLEGVTARRGASRVLDGVTLRIRAGEVVALLGPSGAGKSTIIRLLLGLLAPEGGLVRVRERVASRAGAILIPPDARDVAVVFQDLALWPHLTVAGNLGFVLRAKKVPRHERRARVREVLDRVGLTAKDDRYPGELSGGEQQRVAIARALVTRPSAILLDEPLANLDVVLARELLELVRELLQGGDTAALYVTHDPREAATLAGRLAVLDGGRIVHDGTLDELRAAPATPFVARVLEELGAPRSLDAGGETPPG
ncbi:ABC transporter ATP-binding protein [Haliangium sp.]|uniref:ABC transporter ATP-binding protein n=1 Tax=Haliangium sp. TaxID=2663208 RepID=UPI003D0D1A7B